MNSLNLILGIALIASLGWVFWLHRRLSNVQNHVPPASEPFSPLFHAVAAAFDAGLIMLDAERQVRYLNPQAEMLLNIDAARAIGQGLIALVRDYQVEGLVTDVLRDREAREMILQPFGGERTLRLRAMPLTVDDPASLILIIRDVTHLSMLERARRDMVANVSHELRTPLASVKLLVETLQSGPPPPVSQRMLVQMAQEVDAITQLVDELHELSQIESGRVALQFTPVVLAALVNRTLDRIRPQAERKSLQVYAEISDDLPLVLIDDVRIGQVLLNLLHNAVKFTPAGGNISISACVMTVNKEFSDVGHVKQSLRDLPLPAPTLERRHTNLSLVQQDRQVISLPQPLAPGDWMLVMITDTGIGIPSRDLPRIFERFYKVDRARTRNTGGTGLGLAIAKHLIEGHGGHIWATSQEGTGSTFYFTLPIA